MNDVKTWVQNFLDNYVQGAYRDAIKSEVECNIFEDDFKDDVLNEFNKYILFYELKDDNVVNLAVTKIELQALKIALSYIQKDKPNFSDEWRDAVKSITNKVEGARNE